MRRASRSVLSVAGPKSAESVPRTSRSRSSSWNARSCAGVEGNGARVGDVVGVVGVGHVGLSEEVVVLIEGAGDLVDEVVGGFGAGVVDLGEALDGGDVLVDAAHEAVGDEARGFRLAF